MGLLDRLARRFGFVRAGAAGAGYDAAQISRLTASLANETELINITLRQQLRRLRARSRQAAQNNPYAKRFFQMIVDNVCGPQPFRLQAKIKFNSGKLDERANGLIESEWKDWGRKGECELSGRWSWNTLQRLAVRCLAVDGEVLLRVYRGPEYGRHGYRLQLLDVDRLAEKNEALRDGGAINMGIETDPVGVPVAYHILKHKPAQWMLGYPSREAERVAADEIVHIFVPEFADQCRGIPWIYAALLNLVHMGAFAEAAVIAARVGAAQMGFIETTDGGKTLVEMQGDAGKDPAGNQQFDADPGAFPFLPPGYKLSAWNPKFPDQATGPFIKACLRGIAAGLGVAYHNLSGDMEGVNYSSARVAELDERDAYLAIQTFVADHWHDGVLYPDWLKMQILAGRLPLDITRLDKYLAVYWQAKRWAWVDPDKEVTAALKAIDGRLKSRTRIIAEGGEDIEDVFNEFKSEEDLAKEIGVELPAVALKPAAAQPQPGASDGQTTAQDGG